MGMSQESSVTLTARFPRGLQIGFWLCIGIAVAVVVRRIIALSAQSVSSAPQQLAMLDAQFASKAALTYVHILCSVALVLLLPFLFWRRTRSSLLLERCFFLLGLVVGGTAYAMSVHAVGGWLERSAVLVFNTLFLLSLALAYKHRGVTKGKERWMLRAIAILLGIATTRPVMGIFFATAPLTGLTPQQFFGAAFWIGFSLNTVVMEWWLRQRATGL